MDPSIEKLAQRLWQAGQSQVPCEPLTSLEPDLSLEQAYRISRSCFKRRIQERLEKPIGKKIGLTSVAVQKQLGVSEPDFGYLTDQMSIAHKGSIPAGALIQPRIEGEVAFVLKKSLQGPGVTFEQVVQATDCVIPCVEVIDSRIQNWKIKIQDTVADNASSAYFVLGPERHQLTPTLDLKMAGMALWKNGELESTGVGVACLGHPVLAVAWLANALGRYGETLHAGDLILSGAYGPVVPLAPGDFFEVRISGLGVVEGSYAKK